LTLAFTVIAGIAAGAWATYLYRAERKKDRDRAENRFERHYYLPLLIAAEDLQSRLFNILCRQGLSALRREPRRRWAEETLYLAARYFAFAPIVLMRTTDTDVSKMVLKVRSEFATDRHGVDPWCFFRPTQQDLGRLVLATKAGPEGTELDTVSLTEFEQALSADNGAVRLSVEPALASLGKAARVSDLDTGTIVRLSSVQSQLVDLADHLECLLSQRRDSRFTVSDQEKRKKATVPSDCRPALLPRGNAEVDN
jgi:hypothetical protein